MQGFGKSISGVEGAATSLNGAIGTGFSMDYDGAKQLLTFVQGMQTP